MPFCKSSVSNLIFVLKSAYSVTQIDTRNFFMHLKIRPFNVTKWGRGNLSGLIRKQNCDWDSIPAFFVCFMQ
jgi:hypothetical protein